MAQSINLIPQEEQQLQHKRSIVKSSSILSLLLLLIVGGVAGYYFYTVTQLQSTLDGLNSDIEESRSEIQSMSDIEVTARELDEKYKILTDLFTTRRQYSKLLTDLYARVPENTVTIESFSLSGDGLSQVNLSGEGRDYISIAQFMDTVVDNDYPQASQGLSELFTEVTLNSVNLNQDGRISYFILIDFDAGLLN